MRVRFLRGTALGGIGNDAHPGDERDLPDRHAAQLIAGGRAIEIADAPSDLDAPAANPRKAKTWIPSASRL